MPATCAFGCKCTGSVTHSFPNPEKHPERFEAWVSLFGKKLDATNYELFKKKRVCDIHFANKHKVRNNRLSAIAIPTLYLNGFNDDVIVKAEVDIDNSSDETVYFGDSTDFNVVSQEIEVSEELQEFSNHTECNDDNVIEEVEVEMDNSSDEQSTDTLDVADTKDTNNSVNTSNILEHNYSIISKTKIEDCEDEQVYNVTTKCYMCNVKIATQYNLHCFKCKHIFDLKCLNFTNDLFKSLTKREKKSWTCPSCAKKCGNTSEDNGIFVNNIYKRVKKTLDSNNETGNSSEIKTLKRDIQYLKSRINKFSNQFKQKTKEYDRLLQTKDVEICRLKEIVAELQNCISKK